MDKTIYDALAPAEERVEFGAVTLVARELDRASQIPVDAKGDALLAFFLTTCVFTVDGAPAFSAEDVPEIMTRARRKVMRLEEAITRVNGYAEADNEKK